MIEHIVSLLIGFSFQILSILYIYLKNNHQNSQAFKDMHCLK